MKDRSRIAGGGRLVVGLTLTALALGILGLDAGNRDVKAPRTARPPKTVEIIDESKVLPLLTQQKDKVILANFWATWCGPCREEFPELVKLYQKYQGRSVVVLSFSLDEEKELEQVKKFLKDQKAAFPAYLIRIQDQEKFIDSIDKSWPGSIPATFVYDPKGKLAKRLIGAQELKDFEKAIQSALAAN